MKLKLGVGHLGLLVQEAPLEDAAVECATVNVSVIESVPVDAVDNRNSQCFS
jgi:hypothetical protein